MSLINQTVINCPTLHHSHQFSLSLFLLFFFLLCALHLQVHSHFTRIFLFVSVIIISFWTIWLFRLFNFFFFFTFCLKNVFFLKICFYWVFPVSRSFVVSSIQFTFDCLLLDLWQKKEKNDNAKYKSIWERWNIKKGKSRKELIWINDEFKKEKARD